MNDVDHYSILSHDCSGDEDSSERLTILPIKNK